MSIERFLFNIEAERSLYVYHICCHDVLIRRYSVPLFFNICHS